MATAFQILRRSACIVPGVAPDAIVAMPVHHDTHDLAACLGGLGEQRDEQGRRYAPGRVLAVLLREQRGDGALPAIAAADAGTLSRSADTLSRGMPSWVLIEGVLPRTQRHAGGVRREALRTALFLAAPATGLIATTDADSRLPPNWIARQLDALRAGADLVAGVADVDPREELRLPWALARRSLLEGCYAHWLERIDAYLDPLPYDPWPRHRTPTRASLGFGVAALRRMEPLPAPATDEHRALIERGRALDLKIRFDPELRVVAPLRPAETVRGGTAGFRCPAYANAASESLLEPLDRAIFRARLRARWRRLHAQGLLAGSLDRFLLGFTREHWLRLMASPTFGVLWLQAERDLPRLARRPLRPDELIGQIHAAREWWCEVLRHNPPRTPPAPAAYLAHEMLP
ncbi:hypothetical protein [Frateuria defendens]|uniref:hypothetical protein n=1 Tax=Frateuria defendens TaxID=2219559 RepID=UPI00066FE65B|nr:hypothetical protein [Frateuria defendens]